MNDPVLNRKMFRATALRTGAIRPQRYNVGAGIMGVEGTPFFTNESQGMGPNETRTFTKGSKVYTVNNAGQVIKVDTLPIKYQAPKKENLFFRTAERLLDPEGYKKNVADVKRFGRYMASPAPYKGIASIAKAIPGYAGAEILAQQALPEEEAGYARTGLMATGIADFAKGLGAGKIPYAGRLVSAIAGPGRLLAKPAIGVPVAVGAAGIYGARKLDEAMSRPREFTETDGFLGPAGTKTYVESPYAKQKREYEEVMKIQDPREQELAMGNRPDLFSPMSPDDMMMSAPPLPGSELAQTQGGGEGTGGTGGTTPPQIAAIPASAEKTDTDLNTQINQSVVKKTEIKKDGTTKEIKNTGKDSLPSLSDRLLKFSQTDAGNMFMLKFAAGLLSGKGNFGEVVGNALNPAVDTLAAYRLKEDELAYKQLQALADLKGKQEFRNGMIRITDVDEQGNPYVRAVPAQIDKKTGETFKIENGQRIQVPLEYSNSFREINPGTELNDAIIGYTNTSSAKAIATFIEKLPLGAKGAPGKIKQFANTLIGVGEGVLLAPQSLEFDSEETEKEFNELGTKIKTDIFDKADQSTRDILAQAKIGETALRYFLANAFKQKDRLTNVDLKLINDLVETISLVNARDVTSKMAGIQQLLDTKMFGFKESIRDNGVSDYEFAKRFFGQPGTKIAVGFLAPLNQSETEKRKSFNEMSTREQEDFLRKEGFK